ncbi:MAG: glucose-1-phosphate adenylyltransferase [Acidobacteriota bacterium]
MHKVMGLVLSGGRGERLYPLTKFRSKPAVPLAGKYRIIDIPVSNCLNSGINRIFVLTQFNSASLNKHVVQTYKFDMFSEGFVDILAAEQTRDNTDWFQDTADAVRQSIKHFAPYNVDYLLVLSGDQLYQMDYGRLVDFHVRSGADISVAAIPVTAGETRGLGIMRLDPSGRVASFHEKPKPEQLAPLRNPAAGSQKRDTPGRDYLANMGIYLFQKDFLINLLAESKAIDFGQELFPQSISKHRVFAYVFDGYWTDIGTIRSFYEANLGLTSTLPQFNFHDARHPVFTHPRNLPGSKLNNCNIHQSIVSDGCILNGADIKHSVIGVRSRIGSGTTVKHSVIMGADGYETTAQMEANAARGLPHIGIGNHCTIINAIVDKNARIGDNVSIINAHNLKEKDENNYNIRDGIIVIPKGAVVPGGTVI